MPHKLWMCVKSATIINVMQNICHKNYGWALNLPQKLWMSFKSTKIQNFLRRFRRLFVNSATFAFILTCHKKTGRNPAPDGQNTKIWSGKKCRHISYRHLELETSSKSAGIRNIPSVLNPFNPVIINGIRLQIEYFFISRISMVNKICLKLDST